MTDHYLVDHLDAPSVAPTEGQMIGTFEAGTGRFRTATPVFADNTGLAEGDTWTWDSATQKALPTPTIPTAFDGDYLDAGQIHYPNGAAIINAEGVPILRGTGTPGPTVGFDGFYFLDTAGLVMWGPKGQVTPGQWTGTARKQFAPDTTEHKLAANLELGGQRITQSGFWGLSINAALVAGTSTDIGAQVILGDEGHADPYIAFRAESDNTPPTDIDLRLYGANNGVVYFNAHGTTDKEAKHSLWPSFTAKRMTAEVTLTTGGGNILVPWAFAAYDHGSHFTKSGGAVGAGDTNFDGIVCPAGGLFEIIVHWVIRNDGGGAGRKDSRIRCLATGATFYTEQDQWGPDIPAGVGGASSGIGVRAYFVMATGAAARTVQLYAGGFGSVAASLTSGLGSVTIRRIG